MSEHWTMKYIGKPYDQIHDCYFWFRKIQYEQFGRELIEINIDHSRMVNCAARVMDGDIETTFRFRETTNPSEGDAVFMTQGIRPHHVGVVVFIDGKQYILHAQAGVGVICSDMIELRQNGWRIKGYYHYVD